MLISVFDSEWFEPTGIRLMNNPKIYSEFGTEYDRSDRTTILSSGWSMEIVGKTPDEVASEINKQLKELNNDR